MTHNSSRKHFFAKLLGVVAASSLLPKVFAKSVSAGALPPGAPEASGRSFEVRHDPRAVARRDSV